MSTPYLIPSFEPILALDGYAFVFSQKVTGGMPVLWMDPAVNPYSVATALRLIAEQIDIAADEEGVYTDADRKAGRRYSSGVGSTRRRGKGRTDR
ncbi:hypothetical protein [Nocardia salmonicida]|uniref:hypothetical protein n=1 Tax=Nocardia salmonicida TaxID=53431 RepID=UPI002E28F5E5|nr:hypothetical protein [Nocardia salmonicida]